jgi:excisionase family DNA binding protein
MEQRPTPEELADAGSYNIRGFADFLGCSPRHAYRLVGEKKVRSVRSGTRVLVPKVAARDYLARLIAESTD